MRDSQFAGICIGATGGAIALFPLLDHVMLGTYEEIIHDGWIIAGALLIVIGVAVYFSRHFTR